MSRDLIGLSDGLCTKSRYIPIRPDHAAEECDRTINNMYRDRCLQPSYLVLGFETYMNLCLDVYRHMTPGASPSMSLNMVPKIDNYKKIPLLVDDSLCWGVTVIPPVGKAWPQYGKDDHYERWGPPADAAEPQPGDR